MHRLIKAASIASIAIVLSVIVVSPIAAQSYAVEGLPVGSLSGIDGWSGSPGATVDTSLFSPLDGSTQSIRFRGDGNFVAISRAIGTTINSGVHRISYDLYLTPQVSSNLITRVGFTQADNTEIFVPYAQNGGPGYAQNGILDTDGLGGAPYGYNGLVDTLSYQANQWYRLAATLDFDLAQISNVQVFDISSGVLQFVAGNSGPFFFNNDNTSYVKDWGRLVLVLDPATSVEGWNFDNFRVTTVPEPEAWSIVLLGGIFSTVLRRRHQAILYRDANEAGHKS